MAKFISSDKIFNHLDRLCAWKNDEVVYPVTVELHLSNVCNNKCFYCCADGVKDSKVMTKAETKKAIEYVKSIDAKAIIFSGGGEPSVSPFFEDALYYAEGLDIGVISNGVALDSQKQDTILKTCKWLRISFDADNEELYTKIRGTHSFNIVKSHISEILERKETSKSNCTIGLQIVVNKYNFSRVREIAYWMSKTFPTIDYIQVRPVEMKINEDGYSLNELQEIEPQLKLLRKMSKVIVSDKRDLFFGKKEFGFTKCHCAEFIGAIDAYGDYYLCCHTIKYPRYKYLNVFSDDNLIAKRIDVLNKLPNRGLDPRICFLGCRGSNINRRLEGLIKETEHGNFL